MRSALAFALLLATSCADGDEAHPQSSQASEKMRRPERIERDLAGVETALQRLDAGTYWTDEATGEPIPDEALAADPVARRTP